MKLVYLLVWGWNHLRDKHVICCRQPSCHQRSAKQRKLNLWAQSSSAARTFRTAARKKTQLSPQWLLSMFPDFRLIPRENNLAGWNICVSSSERWPRHVEETFGSRSEYLARSAAAKFVGVFLTKEDSFQIFCWNHPQVPLSDSPSSQTGVALITKYVLLSVLSELQLSSKLTVIFYVDKSVVCHSVLKNVDRRFVLKYLVLSKTQRSSVYCDTHQNIFTFNKLTSEVLLFSP